MQKNNIITPIIALFFSTIIVNGFSQQYSHLVKAASPNPTSISSPTPSPSVSEQTIAENIKKRLQNSLDSEATKSGNYTEYKSFVGIIKDVIKNTLIIEDKSGKKKAVIDELTNIVRSPGNKSIKADSIRIDDYVIAIGKQKEQDELGAVRVIVSSEKLSSSNKKSNLAKISKISKSTLVITPLSSTEKSTLTLTSKTKLKSSLGESLELEDLNIGDSIIYTATSDNDSLTVTTLMRIGFADAPVVSPSPSPTE
ncbi:MAG: hypothetical protein E6R05_06590 [Candidatus Moraniibacteriota bacterium]|nr:MAG: hypothetical protein E6R05_06590 [Candidatus Moranbacteria bacterium]